jgi:aryl-alcohol dehydrogenase-like predicted oxidoreductase
MSGKAAPMRYRPIPGIALEVSDFCLGTMTWGEQNTEAEAHAQLDCAVAHGVNFIDTAEMYPVPPGPQTQGRTETYLGAWLAKTPRDRVVIASKVAGPGRRDWLRGGRTELTRANVTEAVNDSLKRLRTDYIDLYQIHWPGRNVPMFGRTMFEAAREKPYEPMLAQVETMAGLIRAGKIRAWGVSNETSWGVHEFVRLARLHGYPPPVTIQNSYSLITRTFDADLAEVCYREKVQLLAYNPLGGGMLTGKYRGGAKPAGARYALFPDFGPRFHKPMVPAGVDAYAALAARRGLTLVQLALGFVFSRWHLGAAIVGATSVAQLEENLAAARTTLDAETLAEIDAQHALNPNPAA